MWAAGTRTCGLPNVVKCDTSGVLGNRTIEKFGNGVTRRHPRRGDTAENGQRTMRRPEGGAGGSGAVGALWLMVTVWLATVRVPVRALPLPLAATLKLNEPSPDMPPLVMVIQATVLVGVHAQLEPVVTPMLLLRPVDGAETLVGDTLYVQLPAA